MAAVTFEELESLVEGEGEVLIVDVRSTEEFSHGRFLNPHYVVVV